MFNLSTYGKTEQEAQAIADNLQKATDELIAELRAEKAKNGNEHAPQGIKVALAFRVPAVETVGLFEN